MTNNGEHPDHPSIEGGYTGKNWQDDTYPLFCNKNTSCAISTDVLTELLLAKCEILMAQCIVKESGLCSTCSKLGRKQNNEPHRVLDLKELCKTCLAGLRTSYVGVIKEPRKYWAPDE